MEPLLALSFFAFGYVLNMFYISVLYHRGLTHSALVIGPRMMNWIRVTGPLLTGIDPVSWVCMHRMHHLHSDQERDPHSPHQFGLFGVWIAQYKSYRFYMDRMVKRDDPELNDLMKDIPFSVTTLHSSLPYVIHTIIALSIWSISGSFWIGAGYWFGLMSHPLQGWLINGIAHMYGSRNFDTNDGSKNNVLLSLFVFGEGLQNNHHAKPESAKFSMKKWEFDPGYLLVHVAQIFGVLKIRRAKV